MKSPSIQLSVLACIMATASLAPVQAAEVKVTGTGTYAITSSEDTKLADGSTMTRFHTKGVLVDKDPKGPFNLNAQDCDGMVVVSPDAKSASGTGSCDAIDKDGDRWSMWWVVKDDDRWGVTYGTGKFAGMMGGGTTSTVLDLPDRSTFTYEGTLNMK